MYKTVLRALRYTAPLLLFLVLTGLFWRGLQLNPTELSSQLIGKPAPKFSLTSLHGPSTSLTETIFYDKISLVNVWATWCISCRHEHAMLLELQPMLLELNQRQLVDPALPAVQMIGLNFKDDPAMARAWLQKHGDPYQLILVDQIGKTALDWGVYGTPETFVVDQHGIVRYRHVGPITIDTWQRVLLPIISKFNT